MNYVILAYVFAFSVPVSSGDALRYVLWATNTPLLRHHRTHLQPSSPCTHTRAVYSVAQRCVCVSMLHVIWRSLNTFYTKHALSPNPLRTNLVSNAMALCCTTSLTLRIIAGITLALGRVIYARTCCIIYYTINAFGNGTARSTGSPQTPTSRWRWKLCALCSHERCASSPLLDCAYFLYHLDTFGVEHAIYAYAMHERRVISRWGIYTKNNNNEVCTFRKNHRIL